MTDHAPAGPKPIREERRPPREGVEEITPGILRVQLPISLPGLGHVNCYAMEDSRGITLVDPGLPGPRTWRALQKTLRSAGLPVERVHTVIVTHSHPDHFGQAGTFKRKFGAEVITHRAFRTFLDPQAEEADDVDLDITEQSLKAQVEAVRGQKMENGPFAKHTPWGGEPRLMPRSRRLRYWAMRKAAGRIVATPSPTKRVDDAQVLEVGGREWISVHTPGHTIDHLCLYDADAGVMISGDHVLPTIAPGRTVGGAKRIGLASLVAGDRLELDDIGSTVGEQLGGDGSGDELSDLEDPHPIEETDQIVGVWAHPNLPTSASIADSVSATSPAITSPTVVRRSK